MTEKLHDLNKMLKDMTPTESIPFVLKNVEGIKVFSTSFGIEDQLITHFLNPYASQVRVFTLDTGRHFNETYEVFQRTQNKYPLLKIITYFPEPADIVTYVNEFGINGFYDHIDRRKECCRIRKVKPLQKALEGVSLWITGLRAGQSQSRQELEFLEWDKVNKLIKFNPLMNFTLNEVELLTEAYNVPINTLYKKGYLSVGCAPCTRALAPGEDFRAGRWWWEHSEKECGLHQSK